jgi:outer membrane lipoprotein-sorting protein
MSELHEQESEFSQTLRQAPFEDEPRGEHGDALRRQALAAFDDAVNTPALSWWQRAFIDGRELMRRPIPRLLVGAACLLVAAVWLLVPGRQSTAQAFNRMADAIVAAKTARFQMEVAIEGQPKQKFQAYYLAPGKFRQEIGEVVNISDFSAGKIVSLVASQKIATVMNLERQSPEEATNSNYFERFRQLLSHERDADEDHFQRLPEKEIGGKQVIGFRWDSPTATFTLWGDPATGQPVLIESTWNGMPPTEVTMQDFEINVDLKESMFDLRPPKGYKVQSLNVDASKPKEQDLVHALQSFSDLADGQFPDTFDIIGLTAQVSKLMAGKFTAKGQGPTDAEVRQMMNVSMQIGRGSGFVLNLPPAADAHYAGKGVKLNTPDRPIFWYKPEGAPQYRVIYADLLVKDADAAPTVAGAVRLGKPSKPPKP